MQLILSALHAPYREFYQLAIYSGLRTGELLGLRWQDVDLANNLLHIRINLTGGIEKEPKTRGSIRSVELHQEAIYALKSIRCSVFYNSHRVFIDPKTQRDFKNADGIRKYVWKPMFSRIGIKYR